MPGALAAISHTQQTHIEKERKKIPALAAISHTPIRHTLHTLLGGRGSGGDFTYSSLNIIREGRTLPNLEGDLNKCVKRECVKRALPLRLSV